MDMGFSSNSPGGDGQQICQVFVLVGKSSQLVSLLHKMFSNTDKKEYGDQLIHSAFVHLPSIYFHILTYYAS